MSTIHTYQVNHGDTSPEICATTEILGGKLESVAFSAALTENSNLWELLSDIKAKSTCEEVDVLIHRFEEEHHFSF